MLNHNQTKSHSQEKCFFLSLFLTCIRKYQNEENIHGQLMEKVFTITIERKKKCTTTRLIKEHLPLHTGPKTSDNSSTSFIFLIFLSFFPSRSTFHEENRRQAGRPFQDFFFSFMSLFRGKHPLL